MTISDKVFINFVTDVIWRYVLKPGVNCGVNYLVYSGVKSGVKNLRCYLFLSSDPVKYSTIFDPV